MSSDTQPVIKTEPFVHDAADLRALNIRIQISSWWTLILPLVIFGFLVWFFASMIWEAGDFDWMLVGILLAFLVLFAGPWTWRPILTLRSLRREGLLGPQTTSIHRDWLLTEAPDGEGKLRWSAIRRIKRTQTRLFIFSSRTVAHIIPRRAFRSDADFEAFASAAEERWQAHHQ